MCNVSFEGCVCAMEEDEKTETACGDTSYNIFNSIEKEKGSGSITHTLLRAVN